MTFFTIRLSPATRAALQRLQTFRERLEPHMQAAMEQSMETIRQDSIANMHWQHPTGALAASMEPRVESPYLGMVGSADPKSRRREFGFSGMTDSRGRYYGHDPGAFFLTTAMNADVPLVEQLFGLALEQTLEEIAGG